MKINRQNVMAIGNGNVVTLIWVPLILSYSKDISSFFGLRNDFGLLTVLLATLNRIICSRGMI